MPQSVFMGEHTLLQGFHGSSKPEPHLLVKIRLQLIDFDKTFEVAVVPDLSDGVLLSADLGSVS